MTSFKIIFTVVCKDGAVSVAAQAITKDGKEFFGTASVSLEGVEPSEQSSYISHVKAAAIGELTVKMIQEGAI